MQVSRAQTLILLGIALAVPGCTAYGQQPRDDAKKVTLAVVGSRPATVTQRYTCRISSHRHIEVRAPEDGSLQEIAVTEGQAVKKGDLLFKFVPALHQARLDAERAASPRQQRCASRRGRSQTPSGAARMASNL